MNAPQQFILARNPYGPAPVRRPNSVRRTSTIDTGWPDGPAGNMLMLGHARDVFTPAEGGAPQIIAEDQYRLLSSPERQVLEISTTPDRPELQKLVGARGGGHLRVILNEVIPELKATAAPLYLILDDFSGASLVARWIWSQWDPNWMGQGSESQSAFLAEHKAQMTNICTGFAEGSSALNIAQPSDNRHSTSHVPSLRNPADPQGWHAFYDHDKVSMRRARRIDVWRKGDFIEIDAGFQDSGTVPEGERACIHEYFIRATARADDGTLTHLEVDPRVLPFPECPGAAPKAHAMVGQRLSNFRTAVIDSLPGTQGCTHLNDMLRDLAEVSVLAAHLPN
jgi:hypothetical protein